MRLTFEREKKRERERARESEKGEREREGCELNKNGRWWRSSVQERFGLNNSPEHAKNQAILNKHGLKPAHRFWQQHLLETGLRDPANSLHQLLEEGLITVRHGIDKFTPNGVVFVDSREEIPIDTIIFATGYTSS